MGKRGPAPKPTALRVLEGNPGHRPINKNEPKPPALNVKCPAWLSPYAKKEWRRIGPALFEMGLLTDADVQAFAAYCQAYANWREATEFIQQHGMVVRLPSGYIQQVPQVSYANQNLTAMKQFAQEFGLTPSSRSRLYANSADAGKEEEDPMEQLLRQKWN